MIYLSEAWPWGGLWDCPGVLQRSCIFSLCYTSSFVDVFRGCLCQEGTLLPSEGMADPSHLAALSFCRFFLSLFKSSLQQTQSPCNVSSRKVKQPEEKDSLFIAEVNAITLTKGRSLSHPDRPQPS